jgi:ketosteroid isomerase-like protein
MNKTFNTVILFFLGQSAIAQKGIDNLIQAEKNFAAYSVAHSTKEAFQQFIDSNSIMFDKGQPVKAIDFWNKREKRPGVLNWHPQFAEISASEDFGYTTGPWTYQNSLKDSVIARGQYSTVWYLDKNDQWKFLVDFGIDNTQPGSDEERILDTSKEPQPITKAIPHLAPLVTADKYFNQQLLKNKTKAYSTTLSKESIMTRNGFLPASTSADRKALIDSTPSGIKCEMKGWSVSKVPDMGYTYGTAIIKGETQNYMRIWRREKDGWRIALEVMRY